MSAPNSGSARRVCQAKTSQEQPCLLPESLRWRDGFCTVHSPNQMAHEAAMAKAKDNAKKKVVAMREAFANEGRGAGGDGGTGGSDGGGEGGGPSAASAAASSSSSSSLAAKRKVALKVDTEAQPAASPGTCDSPIHTPNLAISRKEKAGVSAGGDEYVSWRGSLSIVLDIDETLVAAEEGHPNMPKDQLDIHTVYLGGDGGEPMVIAIRPWATRFLWYLNDEGFEVYVLTAGSQPYCDAIVTLFNSLAVASGGKATILAGASCRDSYGHVRLKEFEQVLPPYVLPEYAIAVDNKRAAWHPKYQAQVIITPDYLPTWTRGQAETVLMQVLDKALHITYYFEQYYAVTQQFTPTGAILSSMYERQLKAAMIDVATDFQFTHPDATGEDGSFLAFLSAREGQ